MAGILDKIKAIGRSKKKDESKKVTTIELMSAASAKFLSKYYDYEENPDEILAKESRGAMYKLYDEMIWKDPHIKSCTDTRFRTASSRTWTVTPYDDSPESLEQAALVEKIIQNIPQFTECLRKLLGGSIWKGFSVGEIIWEIQDDGVVAIKDIKDKHQNRFRFALDGKLTYQVDESDPDYKDAPPRKFLLFQYNTEAGSSYGTGLAKSLFWFFSFKRGAVKQWVISGEKFNAPTILIKHDGNIDEAMKEKLLAKGDGIMYGASMTVSDDVQIELLEAKRTGGSPYKELIEVCNEESSKVIIGGTLSTDAGKNGTQALGTVHENVRDDILASDCIFASAIINSQLVKWIVDFNYPEPAGYCVFSMQYEPPKDRKAIVEVVKAAVDMGLEIEQDYLYEELNFPKPEQQEGEDSPKLLKPAAPRLPGIDNTDPQDQGQNRKPDKKDANADEQLSLQIPGSVLIDVIENWRNNNFAAAAASFAGIQGARGTHDGQYQYDNSAKSIVTGQVEFSIREDPDRFLPGLPPLPKARTDGGPAPIQPKLQLQRYQIGSIGVHQSKFQARLLEIYGSASKQWLAEFENTPKDMSFVIDDFVESRMKGQLRGVISAANENIIRVAAKDMAKKLGESFNLNLFESLTNDYLRIHAYDSGVIDGIADTIKDVYSKKFLSALNSGDDIGEMVEALKKELPDLNDFQAQRIAVHETRSAANWTVLEMGERSKLDMEAWFIVDPLSCPKCQDVAAGNPYSTQSAKQINLPHIQCNDYWTMTAKAK